MVIILKYFLGSGKTGGFASFQRLRTCSYITSVFLFRNFFGKKRIAADMHICSFIHVFAAILNLLYLFFSKNIFYVVIYSGRGDRIE